LAWTSTTSDVTAIAASFEGTSKIHVWLLGEVTQLQMLLRFLKLYNAADVVTGHYIRGHDLPILSGALMEHGFGALPQKLVSDTKTDLKKRSDISTSQESLSDMLGVTAPKYHMTQRRWRAANRLTTKGLAETKRACRRRHTAAQAASQEASGGRSTSSPYLVETVG